MVTQIGSLEIPPTIDSTPYLKNNDKQKQAASGRLIVKLSDSEKWVIPVRFSEDTMSIEFMAEFYAKCLAMRETAADVTFISPYTGEEVTVSALCISRVAPTALGIVARVPVLYGEIEATFQEV